jgi:hypothetical protein
MSQPKRKFHAASIYPPKASQLAINPLTELPAAINDLRTFRDFNPILVTFVPPTTKLTRRKGLPWKACLAEFPLTTGGTAKNVDRFSFASPVNFRDQWYACGGGD